MKNDGTSYDENHDSFEDLSTGCSTSLAIAVRALIKTTRIGIRVFYDVDNRVKKYSDKNGHQHEGSWTDNIIK